MNGSMYQMMKIVSYVKKRIREGTESSLIMPDSNRSIFFEFLEMFQILQGIINRVFFNFIISLK